MARLLILVLAAVAYLIWVAIYLLPYSGDDALSDTHLRRVFHTAIFY